MHWVHVLVRRRKLEAITATFETQDRPDACVNISDHCPVSHFGV